MRIDRVHAVAFGPFLDQTLELGPGMNVIHGPNEAGKSSWHAALYAGLCGMRRSRGRKTSEDTTFSERHRPWSGSRWEVGAVITLDDGRCVEMFHDLDGQIDCRATDTVLGTDLSDSIMLDGSPDGAAFLGLTRRTLPATLFVRQADLLGVLDDPGQLQAVLQRAVATSGNDATAEQALERIDAFRKQHIGTERANSTRPLATAVARRRAAADELRRARRLREDYQELRRRSDIAESDAVAAEQQLADVTATLAARRVQRLRRRTSEARALWDHFGGVRPTALHADDEVANAVADALAAHRNRPTVIDEATDASVKELEDELARLPDHPSADLEPHETVLAARRRWERTLDALALHAQDEPPAVDLQEEASAGALTGVDRIAIAVGAAGAVTGGVAAGVLGRGVVATACLVIAAVLVGVALRGREAVGHADDVTRRRDAWEGELTSLEAGVARTAAALGAELAARGVAVGGFTENDLDIAVDAYMAACRQRAATAGLAGRRPDLEARLRARRAVDRSVRERSGAQERATRLLLFAAEKTGGLVAGASDGIQSVESIVTALERWQKEQAAARGRATSDDRAWQRLQFLLDGRTIEDLEDDLARRVETLPGATSCEVQVDDDTDAQVAQLTAEARAMRNIAAHLAGQVEDRGTGLPSIAEAEEAHHQAVVDEQRLRRLDATLATAHGYLSKAKQSVHRSIAPTLQSAVAPRLARVTGGRYGEVTVDPATLEVKVREPGGAWRAAQVLSHGTAEQVYLLLRIVLAEHLCTGQESAPLILDDVTVHADDERTQAILDLLHDLSAQRQVVLFTQEADVVSWAADRLVEPTDRLLHHELVGTV